MEKYRFCASCIHFGIVKSKEDIRFECKRLGYETNPKYQFNCWSPKERVKIKIRSEQIV